MVSKNIGLREIANTASIFLNEQDNAEIYGLCDQFNKLSLRDEGTAISEEAGTSNASSSSNTSAGTSGSRQGSITRFLMSLGPSNWCKQVTTRLETPLIEIPRRIFASYAPYRVKMLMGYHYFPDGDNFNFERISVSNETFSKLSFIYDTLGLSYVRRPLSNLSLMSSGGCGLSTLINDEEGVTKILVETITYLDGKYGRILALVILGVGTTVWYGFMPGSDLVPPMGGLFAPFESYDSFFNMDYSAPLFRKLSFVEKRGQSLTASVAAAMENPPFAEIQIPANEHAYTGVSLGIMISFFISSGIIPSVSTAIHIE